MPYNIPEKTNTLRDLIEAVVRLEVEKYNEKPTDVKLFHFLTEAEIEDAGSVGKIGFGRIYNEKKVNSEKAIETALEGFSDGLYKVIINGCEAEDLDSEIALNNGDVLTFLRLTFLAGRCF
jgi:hypothetical protein